MRIIHDFHRANVERETVLTIGAFDGLHLGHQELVRKLILRARQTDRISAVLTFDPIPRAVLDPEGNTTCLITLEDKIRLFDEWGLDLLVILPFTRELANTSAQEFARKLRELLQMVELWVGWNFALGRGRSGNVSALKRIGKVMDFQVHVVGPVRDGQVLISSTEIRNLIADGRVREAAEMLGRYHQLRGVVVTGDDRGKELGFPTANLDVREQCAIPAVGVYAAYASISGGRYSAVVNIGFRPTFGAGERTVEAHLLDFGRDLYGQEMRVEFVERLRAERRFPHAAALCAQIEKDITRAREILQ
jgi:riboflavin kinase/FMN adenylyltransferase